MDLLRLDPTTFLPDVLVEGYNSLIWTERFYGSGEFELITSKMQETAELIPEGSLVTLRDSQEVMFVETHLLTREDDGKSELKIVGRTFDTFLENRVLVSSLYHAAWMTYKQYTDAQFIAMLMWNSMVNGTGTDPTRLDFGIDHRTYVPNLVVTDSTNIADSPKDWSLEAGEVYKVLTNALELSKKLGIRIIRPSGSSGYVVSFDTSQTPAHGDCIKTFVSPITDLRMDVYNGLDRTQYQTDREPVIFHYTAGHIDSPVYLISNKEYKNVAYITSAVGDTYLWPPTTPPPDESVTGLARRFIFVDGGDKEEEEVMEDYVTSIFQKGYTELNKHVKTMLFDGVISLLSPYQYDIDYHLGDLVTLIGEFGFETSMVVNEYTRTQDVNGERGYSGLVRKEEYDIAQRKTSKELLSKPTDL